MCVAGVVVDARGASRESAVVKLNGDLVDSHTHVSLIFWIRDPFGQHRALELNGNLPAVDLAALHGNPPIFSSKRL